MTAEESGKAVLYRGQWIEVYETTSRTERKIFANTYVQNLGLSASELRELSRECLLGADAMDAADTK